MPSFEAFEDNMIKLNVRKDSQIVMYDNMGMFSVARAAWMLKFFGAFDVRILDGGMKKWLSEEKPTARGP
jgi:thiosulfate/3-mercaptopyruvate sulfurtransferase